jgi:hypothetical protein
MPCTINVNLKGELPWAKLMTLDGFLEGRSKKQPHFALFPS